MNGPRRALQVLSELRRRGVEGRAQTVAELGRLARAATLESEVAREELRAHTGKVRAVLAQEDERLRAGLGTMADLERSGRYQQRSQSALGRLERQADRAGQAANAAQEVEREARQHLSIAAGERGAAEALLARREAEARTREQRRLEEIAEDALRARRLDDSVGRRA